MNERPTPVIHWEDGGLSVKNEKGWWVRFHNGDYVLVDEETSQLYDHVLAERENARGSGIKAIQIFEVKEE